MSTSKGVSSECTEVKVEEPVHTPDMDQNGYGWKTSTYTDQNQTCVERGFRTDGRIAVRDTKDRKQGDVLAFGRDGWAAFVTSLKD